jgi:hypothetical protein
MVFESQRGTQVSFENTHGLLEAEQQGDAARERQPYQRAARVHYRLATGQDPCVTQTDFGGTNLEPAQ